MAIRLVKLHEELIAAGIPVEGVSADGRALADGVFERVRVDLKAGATTAQRAQAEAILAAHDPDAPLDPDAETFAMLRAGLVEAAESRAVVAQLMAGLDSLSAEDQSYVLLARLMALKDGYTLEQVQAATTRAEAMAYVAGKAEWKAVPAAVQPMLADMLETMAGLIHVLILVLS